MKMDRIRQELKDDFKRVRAKIGLPFRGNLLEGEPFWTCLLTTKEKERKRGNKMFSRKRLKLEPVKPNYCAVCGGQLYKEEKESDKPFSVAWFTSSYEIESKGSYVYLPVGEEGNMIGWVIPRTATAYKKGNIQLKMEVCCEKCADCMSSFLSKYADELKDKFGLEEQD